MADEQVEWSAKLISKAPRHRRLGIAALVSSGAVRERGTIAF